MRGIRIAARRLKVINRLTDALTASPCDPLNVACHASVASAPNISFRNGRTGKDRGLAGREQAALAASAIRTVGVAVAHWILEM